MGTGYLNFNQYRLINSLYHNLFFLQEKSGSGIKTPSPLNKPKKQIIDKQYSRSLISIHFVFRSITVLYCNDIVVTITIQFFNSQSRYAGNVRRKHKFVFYAFIKQNVILLHRFGGDNIKTGTCDFVFLSAL